MSKPKKICDFLLMVFLIVTVVAIMSQMLQSSIWDCDCEACGESCSYEEEECGSGGCMSAKDFCVCECGNDVTEIDCREI